MTQTKINIGLSVHCHHEILIEYCTDYKKRVTVIKKNKPKNEQEIRLRVFKLLSKEAINALPKSMVKACADWNKACADRHKADADWNKVNSSWIGKEEWHKKFCGCREWNGKELVFEK